jgi:hypothetical protein
MWTARRPMQAYGRHVGVDMPAARQTVTDLALRHRAEDDACPGLACMALPCAHRSHMASVEVAGSERLLLWDG